MKPNTAHVEAAGRICTQNAMRQGNCQNTESRMAKIDRDLASAVGPALEKLYPHIEVQSFNAGVRLLLHYAIYKSKLPGETYETLPPAAPLYGVRVKGKG